jgi:N-acetylglutamate synthase-like GNAT family acetyltransferase
MSSSNSFVVRPAQPSDRAGIDAMLARSYPPLLAPAYDAELLAAALPAMTRASVGLLACPTWFVAVHASGQIVGCGGWTRERPGTGEVEPGLGHVRHFGSDVDHLRQGIARAIGAQTLATARAADIVRLDCYSTLVAEEFYASLGFRTVEAMTVPMPRLDRPGTFVDFPALLMRCEL